MVRHALTITNKDLSLLARDRRALIVLLALPLVLIGVIGSSTGRLLTRNTPNQPVRISWATPETGTDAARLYEGLTSVPGVELVGEKDDADVRLLVATDFQHDAGTPVQLQPVEDQPRQWTADGISVELQRGDQPLLGRFVSLALRSASLPGPSPAEGTTTAESTTEQAPEDPGRVYRAIVPGYTVLFVFFLVNIMGRSFIQERELGTLARLRMAPVTATSILTGKTFPFLLVSLLQTTVLLSAGVWLFGMGAGQAPWLLVPLVLSTSLAATCLGLAFSTLARTDAQVSAWGNLIVLATAGISGCLVPRHWMPELAQQVSLATPHAWALIAYREILTAEVPSVGRVAGCCLVLLGFAAVFFATGLRGFRRQSA